MKGILSYVDTEANCERLLLPHKACQNSAFLRSYPFQCLLYRYVLVLQNVSSLFCQVNKVCS